MEKITCIIVDDETQNRKLLRTLLEEYCTGVEVLAEAADVKQAVTAINEFKPEVVFLDVEMPGESGFALYKYFDKIDFEIIFVTAYSQYAIRAVKLAALDYIVKPISLEELMEALERFREKRAQKIDSSENHRLVEQAINNPSAPSKIGLSCSNGYVFVEVEDIIRCEADKSYTVFVMKDKSKIITSKNLASYEPVLCSLGFKRAHRSHLINPTYIKRFVRGKNPILVMEDDTEIMISANRKDDVLKDFLMP